MGKSLSAAGRVVFGAVVMAACHGVLWPAMAQAQFLAPSPAPPSRALPQIRCPVMGNAPVADLYADY